MKTTRKIHFIDLRKNGQITFRYSVHLKINTKLNLYIYSTSTASPSKVNLIGTLDPLGDTLM